MREWLETPYDATRYLYRGGSWDRTNDAELKSSGVGYQVPNGAGSNLGFRIVRVSPVRRFCAANARAPVVLRQCLGFSFSPLPAFAPRSRIRRPDILWRGWAARRQK